MLDIGWSELLILGIAALLVVGPKDLPGMFRTVGQYVGKARGMAREFQRSMEDAARQADLEDVRKAAESVKDVGRLATGGTAGLTKFGMDKTRKFAEEALNTGSDTSTEETVASDTSSAQSPTETPAETLAETKETAPKSAPPIPTKPSTAQAAAPAATASPSPSPSPASAAPATAVQDAPKTQPAPAPSSGEAT